MCLVVSEQKRVTWVKSSALLENKQGYNSRKEHKNKNKASEKEKQYL